MFVERYGHGDEIYFALHGWGGTRRTFAPLAPFVPDTASLYSADLPGCGDSPAPRDWSIGAVVAEIVEATRETGAPRVNFIGNCGGAVFALLAAQEMGGAVGRVVMIDPFAYLPRYFRLFIAGEFGRHAYNATFANPIGRWLTNQSLRGKREGQSDLTASFAGVDHEVARHYIALFAEVGSVERFKGFGAPVEIAHGEKTFGAVRRSLALWREVLPDARISELKNAGHLPFEEATELIAELIFGSNGQLNGSGERKQVEV